MSNEQFSIFVGTLRFSYYNQFGYDDNTPIVCLFKMSLFLFECSSELNCVFLFTHNEWFILSLIKWQVKMYREFIIQMVK